MASVFKATKDAERYTILYYDENGKRRKLAGYTDKRESMAYAVRKETECRKIKNGETDRKDLVYRDHGKRPLSEHVTDWQASLTARGHTDKHAGQSSERVRRLVAIMLGARPDDVDGKTMTRAKHRTALELITGLVAKARLADLSADRVQGAIATLRDSGRSLQTCNHYRACARAFIHWAWKDKRVRDNSLIGLEGFNAKEDRRHDRRTVSLEELHRLIEAARRGPDVMGMTGNARALCYRLAVATGLRYEEISSVTPESFDWEASTVSVAAAYTKNGEQATLSLPGDLVDDLRAYVAIVDTGAPIFALPAGKGAKMMRVDLVAAGIDYRDGGGLVFDFHSLRCELATLADAAGVSPRVVQRMMRHSTLELTGRYTRPRAVDIEAAAGMLPSLKPVDAGPEALAATGTGGRGVQNLTATENAPCDDAYGCNPMGLQLFASNRHRSTEPKVTGSNPVGCTTLMVINAADRKFGLLVVQLRQSRHRRGSETANTSDAQRDDPPLSRSVTSLLSCLRTFS